MTHLALDAAREHDPKRTPKKKQSQHEPVNPDQVLIRREDREVVARDLSERRLRDERPDQRRRHKDQEGERSCDRRPGDRTLDGRGRGRHLGEVGRKQAVTSAEDRSRAFQIATSGDGLCGRRLSKLDQQPRGAGLVSRQHIKTALTTARQRPRMSPTPVSTTAGPSETSPLLPPPSDTAHAIPPADDADADDDDDEVKDPVAARKSLLRWIAFWLAFTALTIVLVVEAFKQGGGEFDWKGALKKAGGGVRASHKCQEACVLTLRLQGISGAAAMVIQVLTLMPLRTMMK